MIIQAIVYHEYIFRDICIGWPGSAQQSMAPIHCGNPNFYSRACLVLKLGVREQFCDISSSSLKPVSTSTLSSSFSSSAHVISIVTTRLNSNRWLGGRSVA